MKHKPTVAEVFEATQVGVLKRIITSQRQQIADLKQAAADSVQRERAARRRLYEVEGATLIKKQEEATP